MNLIVLVDSQWGIGCQGDQNVYLSQDLKRFKEITQNTTVVLGRKTLATFPKQKPLPHRRNLILSRDPSFSVEGGTVVPSISQLQSLLSPDEQVFVIGGASVYHALLPFCTKAYVTKVHTSLPADCHMPNLDQDPLWSLTEESEIMVENGFEFSYCLYTS